MPGWISRPSFAAAALVLLAITFVGHGGSLYDGLFFDDYWHQVTLGTYGWSFDDLVESATFDVPGELVQHWWQTEPLKWRYARPVAMFFMKIEYVLSGGDGFYVHAFALLWHWLTAVLVWRLAAWALRHNGWALLAAGLFVIEPQSAIGISWIAARNAGISGLLFMLAVVLYARTVFPLDSDRPLRRQWPWIAGAAFAWLAALFSRETAIVFPLVVLTLDLLRGWRAVWNRWGVYVVLGVVGLGYLYWRLLVFPTIDPPDIYFTAPSGPGYLLWAVSKLLQMLVAMWWHLPLFLGIATYDGLSADLVLTHLALLVMIGIIAFWYLRTCRSEPTRWVWPIWVVAAFAPVIPVFMMPHFGYLAAPAVSIMLAIMLRHLRGRKQIGLLVLIVASHCWSLAIYRFVWRGIVRSEQLIYDHMTYQDGAPSPGTQLFLIDLPVCGIYNAVAMRAAWQQSDLQSHVLTYAPHPLQADIDSTVEVVDARTLIVRAAPPGYFAGMSGAMLLDGMRAGLPLEVGDVIEHAAFTVTVLDKQDGGVTGLRFVFPRPLADPGYRFYVSSLDGPARRLRFDDAPEPPVPFNEVYATQFRERRAYFAILEFIGQFVESDLVMTGK